MRNGLAILLLISLASIAEADCYRLQDRNGKLLQEGHDPPFSLELPVSAGAAASRARGESLQIMPDGHCVPVMSFAAALEYVQSGGYARDNTLRAANLARMQVETRADSASPARPVADERPRSTSVPWPASVDYPSLPQTFPGPHYGYGYNQGGRGWAYGPVLIPPPGSYAYPQANCAVPTRILPASSTATVLSPASGSTPVTVGDYRQARHGN